MARDGIEQHAFLLAWGILLGAGIFLAVRNYQVASAVLGDRAGMAAGASAEADGSAGADSSFTPSAAREISKCDRNPFAEPAVRVAMAEPGARPEPRPVARFLMVDATDRVVQIAVGDSLSPRLRVGDRFLGWSVIAIHPSSVTVSKAGKSVVLSSP